MKSITPLIMICLSCLDDFVEQININSRSSVQCTFHFVPKKKQSSNQLRLSRRKGNFAHYFMSPETVLQRIEALVGHNSNARDICYGGSPVSGEG